MKKFLLTTIISTTITLGIELSISPDKEKEVEVKEKELKMTQNILGKKKKKISRYIRENRMLANLYLKKYAKEGNKKWEEFLQFKKLNIEEALSNMLIDINQSKQSIDEKVIKSYYIVHRNDFKKPKTLELKLYSSQDYKKAVHIYTTLKKEGNYTSLPVPKEMNLSISQVFPYIRDLFKNAKKGDILPPLFFKDSFIIFQVKDIKPEEIMDFKEVKEDIKSILFYKTREKIRKEILSSLSEQR